LEDLFIGHIVSMDTLARALLIADRMLNDSGYVELKRKRYESFDKGHGGKFEKGDSSLEELAKLAAEMGEPELRSGKQELFEGLVNRYLR
jgi:xylose isomerase